MNDQAYQTLQTLKGKPNNLIEYPWSYDPLLMAEYFNGMAYKPAYLRDLDLKTEDNQRNDYILNTLYATLKTK